MCRCDRCQYRVKRGGCVCVCVCSVWGMFLEKHWPCWHSCGLVVFSQPFRNLLGKRLGKAAGNMSYCSVRQLHLTEHPSALLCGTVCMCVTTSLYFREQICTLKWAKPDNSEKNIPLSHFTFLIPSIDPFKVSCFFKCLMWELSSEKAVSPVSLSPVPAVWVQSSCWHDNTVRVRETSGAVAIETCGLSGVGPRQCYRLFRCKQWPCCVCAALECWTSGSPEKERERVNEWEKRNKGAGGKKREVGGMRM